MARCGQASLLRWHTGRMEQGLLTASSATLTLTFLLASVRDGRCLHWLSPFAGVGKVNITEKARGNLGSCRYKTGTESWYSFPRERELPLLLGKLRHRKARADCLTQSKVAMELGP